jgi:hypothetical protein
MGGERWGEARGRLRVNAKASACLRIVGFHYPLRDRDFAASDKPIRLSRQRRIEDMTAPQISALPTVKDAGEEAARRQFQPTVLSLGDVPGLQALQQNVGGLGDA